MRPDRIVVGEVRGGEALDMLQAMNTGHDGSLTTVHANTPRDALSRVETMVAMAGIQLPERAMRQQIASRAQRRHPAVARARDGTRRVTSISEITGMEGDVITMQEIFCFEKQGVDAEGKVVGRFRATGMRPQFSERLRVWHPPAAGDVRRRNGVDRCCLHPGALAVLSRADRPGSFCGVTMVLGMLLQRKLEARLEEAPWARRRARGRRRAPRPR